MKNGILSWANSSRGLCFLLALILLACSSVISTVSVSAESNVTASETVGSVKVNAPAYHTALGQAVYLKPSTTYKFSYKFTVDKADQVIIKYYTSETGGSDHNSISGATYDEYYNMVTYTFTTVSADTDGIITDDDGNIKTYVGINSYGNNGTALAKYTDYAWVFGDFCLTEITDDTNLFSDLYFQSVQNSQNDTESVWGQMNRGSGFASALIYGKYYENSQEKLFPTREFFLTGPEYKAVKLKNNASPYLVQRVWLKPATTYVFSYYYTNTVASKFVYYNTGKETDLCKTSDGTLKITYDAEWNKVNYEFTTVGTDNADATFNSDKSLVQAAIGIRCYTAVAVGSYFADFTLCEVGDQTETNCLTDTRFTNIGIYTSNHKWDGWFNSTLANNYYERATYASGLTSDSFKRSYNISLGTYDGGTVTSDQTKLSFGDTVNLSVTPDDGYKLLELQANGKSIPCVDGKYTFDFSNRYADPSTGNVAVTAKFIAKDTEPAFKANDYPAARAVTQDVWLEPETEYVFSYRYTDVTAGSVKVGYVKASGGNQDITVYGDIIYEDGYKSYGRKFKTPALTAADVTVGTGQNEGLVKCTVGFQFNNGFANQEVYFGAPKCYKSSDSFKTNLLTNLDFSSIGTTSGVWHSYWSATYNQIGAVTGKSDVDFRKGDVNGNREIDICDLVKLNSAIGNTESESALVKVNCDMNNDNVYDVLDITALRKILLYR